MVVFPVPMNMPPRSAQSVRSWSVAVIVVLVCGCAVHAGPVKPLLSRDACRAGEEVELTYDFTLATVKEPDMPGTIEVDGLRFTLDRKRSSDWGLVRQYKYVYTATAERPGDFKIPALEVRAGKTRLETRGIRLKVDADPGKIPPAPAADGERPPFYPFNKPAGMPSPRPDPADVAVAPSVPGAAPRAKPLPSLPPATPAPRPPAPGGRSAFAEMEIATAKAFVGEVVPLTLRYYLRADMVFDGPLQQPYIAGDGFAALPLREATPAAAVQTLKGADYNVIVFRTAIVPARAGAITIPPAVMKGRLLVGRGWTQQPAGLPAPAGGELKDFEVAAPGRHIEARDLPLAGRPDTFTGAVGDFSAAAPSVHPPRVGPGEPVALQLSVSGSGNFAAMQPPVLNRLRSWRDYKPEVSMAESGGPGGGTKTFKFTLIARQDEQTSPGAELSYFDPRQEKYITLRFDPVPLTAEGPLEGKDFVAVTQPEKQAEQPLSWRHGFLSVVRSPWFYVLQALLLALIVAWVLLLAARKRRMRLAGDTNLRLEADLRAAWVSLRAAAGAEPAAFYAAGANVLMARLALMQGKPAAAADADRLLCRLVGNMVRREELLALLSRSDELNYGEHEGGSLAPAERDKVNALLEEFCGPRS